MQETFAIPHPYWIEWSIGLPIGTDLPFSISTSSFNNFDFSFTPVPSAFSSLENGKCLLKFLFVVDIIIAQPFSFVNTIFDFSFKNLIFFLFIRLIFHNFRIYYENSVILHFTSMQKDPFSVLIKSVSFSFHLPDSCAILTSA